MWVAIIKSLLPLIAGFDIYAASPAQKFVKIDLTKYETFDYTRVDHLAIALSDRAVAPYETEKPVMNLESKVKSVPGIRALKLINRTGPFYGWYLRIEEGHNK